jgi:hypothetical protein
MNEKITVGRLVRATIEGKNLFGWWEVLVVIDLRWWKRYGYRPSALAG